MSRNEITGDIITVGSETNNKAYEDGWDRIFGKKDAAKLVFTPCVECPPNAVCKSPLCRNLEKMAKSWEKVPVDAYTPTLHNNEELVYQELKELASKHDVTLTLTNKSAVYYTPQDGYPRKLVFEDSPTLHISDVLKLPEGTTCTDKDSY